MGHPERVFIIDPTRVPEGTSTDHRPALLWAAPGSLFTDEVDRAWARRGSIPDLAEVPGPWSAVLWDPVGFRHVVASDPVGVQPVFLARTTDGRLAVASQLAALVDRADVDDALDEEGTLLDLLNLSTPEVAHRTPFTAVERVPWGSAVEIDASGRRRRIRYWDPEQLPGPDRSLSLDDCAELLRERIDGAVRRLLPADGTRVGAHVSSGLDCTTMACRANQVLREQGSALVAGYSWAPDEHVLPRLEHDERSLLDEVTLQEGFAVRTIGDETLGRWFDELDPCRFPQSTHYRERHVLPVAQADGVTTILSGWGGDELASFNGRATPIHLVRTGRWPALWSHMAAKSRIRSDGSNARGTVARSFVMEVLSSLRPRSGPFASTQWGLEADPTAVEQVSPLAAELVVRKRQQLRAATDHHAYQLALFTNGHIQHRCGWWYQTGQLFGIDYRYPLLDLGVVTAALRLPWWAYRSEGWNRLAYRKAVVDWIPASITWNVLKNEPAITAERQQSSRVTVPGAEPAPGPRRRPVDDGTYQRLLELCRPVRPSGGPRANAGIILSRPEAAPR